MSRVFVFGIDSLDRVMVERWRRHLPNLDGLLSRSHPFVLQGVFPPDSPTSWASIFTGLNPAGHGVLSFVDHLEKTSQMLTRDVDYSTVRGHTFWDMAGEAGLSSLVLFPVVGFPVWEIRGVMVGRSASTPRVECYPQDRFSERDLEGLSNLEGMPGVNVEGYVDRARGLAEREAEFCLSVMGDVDWDLMMVYSSVLDPVQHALWSYVDEDDPDFSEGNGFGDSVLGIYRLYDEILGRFLSRLDNDTNVVVLSDHGHTFRPFRLVDVNRILSSLGYQESGGMGAGKRVMAGLRNLSMRMVGDLRMQQVALSVMRRLPVIKDLASNPAGIDESAAAYFTDLSGIKAYSYGGIRVNQNLLGDGYERARERIMAELMGLRDPDTGKEVLRWARNREEVYEGKYVEKLPDVLLYFFEEYGGSASPGGSLFFRSHSRKIQPGNHCAETPVLAITGPDAGEVVDRSVSLMDICPTILQLLGVGHVDGLDNFDGRSLFAE